MDDRIYLKKTIQYFKRLNKLIFQVSCPGSGLHWSKYLFSYYLSISFPFEHTRRRYQGLRDFETGYFLSHHNESLLELAQDIIDNVYLVLLIRDPKDVVPSWLNGEDKEFNSDNIINRSNHWNRYIQKYYVKANYIIHYEDICLYPVETLGDYFKYIEIEPVRELNLESFQQFDSTIRSESQSGTVRPVKLSNENRLLTHSDSYELSEELKALVWETCNYNMEKLGYWEDGNKWLDKLS